MAKWKTREMASWRELITKAMESNDDRWRRGTGESWDDVIACTLTEDQLDEKFDDGYGAAEGKPFTLWTSKYVYFPVSYDGSEWVGFVSRNPDGLPTEHWGGG